MKPLAAALALAAAPAFAAELDGLWESPLGTVRFAGDGASWRGTLVQPTKLCPSFKAGDEIVRGTLLDDSISGQVRVCLKGKKCAHDEEWGSSVLLVGRSHLSGAVHAGTKTCSAPLGKRGGIQFRRQGDAPPAAVPPVPDPPPPPDGKPPPPAPPPIVRYEDVALPDAPADAPKSEGDRRAKAKALMRDAAAWMNEGNFEQAQKQFLDAIAIDKKIPEAFNGVGVTYRMRNELPDALVFYKKALDVDPDFGDAYYNMACVYALQGKKDMALRYLKIAALNGYATSEGIDSDPDLSNLRDTPEYKALKKKNL